MATKKTILLALFCSVFYGCTSEPECDKCKYQGQFVNVTTGETINQPTDCDRTPPEGYVFVKCLGRPDY